MQYNISVFPYLNSIQVRFFSDVFTCSCSTDEVIDDFKSVSSVFNDSSICDDNNVSLLEDDLLTDEDRKLHSQTVSANRCKNQIYNIARSNKWKYFVTLTFNQKEYDSSSWEDIVNHLKQFLKRLRRICPNIKYLCVPELHHDGIHYHFHLLMSEDLPFELLVDSGIVQNECKIYNLPLWKYGFSTVSIIKDTEKASSYIGKYVTKDLLNHLINKKRYFCSKNCRRTEPLKLYLSIDDIKKFIMKFCPDYMKSLNHQDLACNYLEFNTNQYIDLINYLRTKDLTDINNL